VRPAGNPVAANLSGACPVVGMVKRNGLPGMEPTKVGCWIRGVAGALSIEMVMSVCAAKAGADSNVAQAAAIVSLRLGADRRAELLIVPGGFLPIVNVFVNSATRLFPRDSCRNVVVVLTMLYL
jgi:hypothetical protein